MSQRITCIEIRSDVPLLMPAFTLEPHRRVRVRAVAATRLVCQLEVHVAPPRFTVQFTVYRFGIDNNAHRH